MSSRVQKMQLSWLSQTPEWSLEEAEEHVKNAVDDRVENHPLAGLRPRFGLASAKPAKRVKSQTRLTKSKIAPDQKNHKLKRAINVKSQKPAKMSIARPGSAHSKSRAPPRGKRPRVRPRSASVQSVAGQRAAREDHNTGTIGELYMVKHERRRLDFDCQLLENRIKLLQKEEDKIRKRISKTRVETKSIKQQRQKEHQKEQEKQEQKERKQITGKTAVAKEQGFEVEQRRRALERGIKHMNKDMQQKRILEEKAAKAKELKSARLKIRAEIAEMRKARVREKHAKSEKIRQEKEAAKAKIAREEQKRQALFEKALKEKLHAEQEEKRGQEEKLRRLEELEEECIHRLERKSTKQHVVRINLEKTLKQA